MTHDRPIRLIVNADDLGWSEGVNAGIFRAHREGIVTSATLAANMPAAKTALARLQSGSTSASNVSGRVLGVGLHLNVCQGPALSRRGRSVLADAGGVMNLTGSGVLRRCLVRPRRTLAAIEAEFDAQAAWCLDRGLRPTHADTHRHVHAWPAIFRLVERICRRYDIPFVRRHREVLPGAAWPPAEARQRRISKALTWLGSRCRRIAPQRFATTGTLGVAHTGRIDVPFLLAAIGTLEPGTTEIMIHPGYADDLPAEQTRLLASRSDETEAACDGRVIDLIARRGIELVHYGQLR